MNALSHSIKPTVTYYLIGNEHILSSDAITNIHLDEVIFFPLLFLAYLHTRLFVMLFLPLPVKIRTPKLILRLQNLQTASTYERQIIFKIKNDGSATFLFDWRYNSHNVKKYLIFSVEPKSGRVAPATAVECIVSFTLKDVPVRDFPVTLAVSVFYIQYIRYQDAWINGWK